MVSVVEFEKQFIKIIDRCIVGQSDSYVKNDFSLVTDCDLLVERELIKYIRRNFDDIYIVSEENPSSHLESYNLVNKFAVIDPIDGTENYYYTQSNYGSVVSVVYDDFVYHGIYIPCLNQILSSRNISSFQFKHSPIKLLSTSCLGFQQNKESASYQNYRILGSSSYMFFLLLTGAASSYDYCGKAKIWDYYTGINLLLMINEFFEITLGGVNIDTTIIKTQDLPHKCSFRISVKSKNKENK